MKRMRREQRLRNIPSDHMRFSHSLLPAKITGVLTIAVAFLASVAPSTAIENLRIVRGVLILEGKIEAGDYKIVRDFLAKTSNYEKMKGQVFLASQGGSIDEATKIGYLIRHLQLSTDAPSRPP